MRRFTASLSTVLLCACGSMTFEAAASSAKTQDAEITNADLPAIKKMIKEELMQAFMDLAAQSTKKFESMLAEDVRLKWPMKESVGKKAFIATIAEGFKSDAALFNVASSNYDFLVKKCGLNNPSQKPIGPAPQIEIIKDIQGQDKAANRFLVVAKFKHSWMKSSDEAYVYVDRWVVKREKGQLKIAEYEFTANQGEMPAHPTPLTQCP